MNPQRRYSAGRNFIYLPFIICAVALLCACRQSMVELPIPPLVIEPPPATAAESLAALEAATIPERDRLDLAERLTGRADLPRLPADPPAHSQGDVASFWYTNRDSGQNEQVQAQLVLQTAELNLWVEEGERVRQSDLQRAAVMLEEAILPTNRAFFGEEWRPGIDGDPRLHILHLGNIGRNVAGFFSASDEFTTAINPFSNERELLYVNLRYVSVGSDAYYELIAHEMQHLIHWYGDSNESTWLNEGLAVLAAFLNGYPSAGYEEGFAANPDVQLNNFAYSSDLTTAHYGSAFYLTAYFLDRYGAEATQELVRHPADGIGGVEAVLAEVGEAAGFDAFFADWVVANYLDSRGRGEGVYQYGNLDVPELAHTETVRRFPAGGLDAVHQYAADYLQIRHEEPVTVVFTGTQQTRLLDTSPHSGDYFWTTLPGDSSNMRLTGEFDLSGLETATLSFWTWFDIEEDWDYAYVAVSVDSGASWELLETEAMSRDNPQGNSYGPALTGYSGGGESPVWIEQQADLTRFAGRPVLVHFEYVTDDTLHEQGWAIDDIAIPQLELLDDVEEDSGRWRAEGFARHANILPQSFIVQAIYLGAGTVRVETLPLDENRRGRWTLALDDEISEVVLVIAANTPFTSQRATFAWAVE